MKIELNYFRIIATIVCFLLLSNLFAQQISARSGWNKTNDIYVAGNIDFHRFETTAGLGFMPKNNYHFYSFNIHGGLAYKVINRFVKFNVLLRLQYTSLWYKPIKQYALLQFNNGSINGNASMTSSTVSSAPELRTSHVHMLSLNAVGRYMFNQNLGVELEVGIARDAFGLFKIYDFKTFNPYYFNPGISIYYKLAKANHAFSPTTMNSF